jgi:hypothetical protein
MSYNNEDDTYEMNYYTNDWKFYAHMPHDPNWNIQSYKEIMKLRTVEQSITLFENINDILYKNCMLFLMRENIKPMWEDKLNRKGGCFSFKVANEHVPQVWKDIMYSIMGGSLSTNTDFMKSVNGCSISPKKHFCIVKIWMRKCKYTKASSMIDIANIDKSGVLFKKIIPSY